MPRRLRPASSNLRKDAYVTMCHVEEVPFWGCLEGRPRRKTRFRLICCPKHKERRVAESPACHEATVAFSWPLSSTASMPHFSALGKMQTIVATCSGHPPNIISRLFTNQQKKAASAFQPQANMVRGNKNAVIEEALLEQPRLTIIRLGQLTLMSMRHSADPPILKMIAHGPMLRDKK